MKRIEMQVLGDEIHITSAAVTAIIVTPPLVSPLWAVIEFITEGKSWSSFPILFFCFFVPVSIVRYFES